MHPSKTKNNKHLAEMRTDQNPKTKTTQLRIKVSKTWELKTNTKRIKKRNETCK